MAQLDEQDEGRNLDPEHFLRQFNHQFQRIINQVQRSEEFTLFTQEIKRISAKVSNILDNSQVVPRQPSP